MAHIVGNQFSSFLVPGLKDTLWVRTGLAGSHLRLVRFMTWDREKVRCRAYSMARTSKRRQEGGHRSGLRTQRYYSFPPLGLAIENTILKPSSTMKYLPHAHNSA